MKSARKTLARSGRHAAVILFMLSAQSGTALPQSLEPMRGAVDSFTDRFAVQVYPGNPYKHPIKLDVRVYDQNLSPIQARVFPHSFVIGAGEKRRVLVVVPFDGQADRRVKVCVESLPNPLQLARIRTQICANFRARNVG